ncbi:MAG: C40 family peptidase [Bacteroidia bacterium]|nr:C40 family peptidase [Bacteroidia bacterium]
MFAICNLTLVPVRKESSDRSEMVSQLLFGDIIEILDKHKSWYKVKMLADDYIGWIDQKQVALITDEEKANYDAQSSFISNDILQIAILNNSEMSTIVMGSTLPFYSNKKLSFGGNNYSFEGNTVMVTSKRPDNITLQAQLYLNSPYLWGGRSPFGIDCSGLTQIVYKICGYKLPRDAIQQAEQGETISFLEETIPGDLAFFDNEEGKIIHVGIITHGSNIIHASGKVRMDKLDHQGIFNAETKKYSHKLRLIKRHIS